MHELNCVFEIYSRNQITYCLGAGWGWREKWDRDEEQWLQSKNIIPVSNLRAFLQKKIADVRFKC